MKANLVTQGDYEVDFSEEKKEKKALLFLMAFEDEDIEIYHPYLYGSSDDDMYDLYSELYKSLLKAKNELNMLIRKLSLHLIKSN